MLEHSQSCEELVLMAQKPRIPLHPDPRIYALTLLQDNLVPISQLRLLCRKWANDHWGDIPGDTHHRYTLTRYESTSLYRTLARESGMPQQSGAVGNLEKWFRADNPQPPNPLLTQSCMYYRPLGDGENDRFILILSTPQQRQLAWKHGHKQQILMDGTFGVCSAKLLVFILMVIDERGIGIPVALILFTALKHAKATHASYDGAILEELLQKWKDGMGVNEENEAFEICVGNTDNDTRERNALQGTWLSIHLILCLFHTWQS